MINLQSKVHKMEPNISLGSETCSWTEWWLWSSRPKCIHVRFLIRSRRPGLEQGLRVQIAAFLHTDLFCWWGAVFTGEALDLGGWRSFQLTWAGNRRGCGATTGPVWVACTRMVNCNKNKLIKDKIVFSDYLTQVLNFNLSLHIAFTIFLVFDKALFARFSRHKFYELSI